MMVKFVVFWRHLLPRNVMSKESCYFGSEISNRDCKQYAPCYCYSTGVEFPAASIATTKSAQLLPKLS